MTIVNDDSSVVNKLEALLIDDTRGVIYGRHMFIIQVIGNRFVNFLLNEETELFQIVKILW